MEIHLLVDQVEYIVGCQELTARGSSTDLVTVGLTKVSSSISISQCGIYYSSD